MKNLYLSVTVICIVVILILMFQNVILNQTAWMFFSFTNSGILAFITGILGFVGGISFLLYYYARQAEGDKNQEDSENF